MNVPHPDGRTLIFMHAGSQVMVEMEIKYPGWTSFGYLGPDNSGLLVDHDMWDAFVALVNEVDAVKRTLPKIEEPMPLRQGEPKNVLPTS